MSGHAVATVTSSNITIQNQASLFCPIHPEADRLEDQDEEQTFGEQGLVEEPEHETYNVSNKNPALATHFARRNGPGRLGKYEVRYRYHCEEGPSQQKTFRWGVQYFALTERVEFTKILNIGNFIEEQQYGRFPITFLAGFRTERCVYLTTSHCWYYFTGYFEGEARPQSTEQSFIVDPNLLKGPSVLRRCEPLDTPITLNTPLRRCEMLRVDARAIPPDRPRIWI